MTVWIIEARVKEPPPDPQFDRVQIAAKTAEEAVREFANLRARGDVDEVEWTKTAD